MEAVVDQMLTKSDRDLNQRELAQAADLDGGYTGRIVRRFEKNGW